MCGIFGIYGGSTAVDVGEIARLAALSSRRGRDSSGLVYSSDGSYGVARADLPVGKLIKGSTLGNSSLIAGHTRLITDGEADNQPVIRDGVIVLHNGIIVNPEEYWAESSIERLYEIDTEVIVAQTLSHLKENRPVEELFQKITQNCKGSFSCAILIPKLGKMVLMSNTGSLYVGTKNEYGYFASERSFLCDLAVQSIEKLLGSAVIDIPSSHTAVTVTENRVVRRKLIPELSNSTAISKYLLFPEPSLRRCSKCILPETMPFIRFDAAGECNYCANYTLKNTPKPKLELEELFERYKSTSGKKVIVPFSGGRDSSYALALIKNEFGMEPITMTYDWGMVTDLARRNISRMCANLGVENILIADDIQKKRRNIKLNLKAWLKKPDLGMVNILMAGDKHFFRHIQTVRRETGISLNVWGMNPLEVTYFKAGFLGFAPDFAMDQVFNTGFSGQVRYQGLRAKAMFKNPRYLNRSLWDTLSGEYYRSVKAQSDFYNLFDYWPWDETDVDNALDSYDWERAEDTKSTWRIGDGTAAFYNYVYYTLAGFTEYDTFRSNQVREGQLPREAALKLVAEENQPRYQNIKWYLDALGMNFETVMQTINSAPRKYDYDRAA
ncbi:hypothetical protein N9Z13_03125 [Luminiphilus sp.]|nr:hypothetical protein [Luminiphilus sp.]